MATGTGAPVGSKSPVDLLANSENLDHAVNTDAPTWTDRFGNPRPALKRLETDYPLAGVYSEQADLARIAAEQARSEAQGQAVEAATQAQQALHARTLAELAAGAAFTNADIYPDVATGRAAVANGQQFQVASADGLEMIRYRRDSASVSPEVARYPTAAVLARLKTIEQSRGVATGKNQFNAAEVVEGFEIHSSGQLLPRSDSSVSGLMYVADQKFVALSGFQTPTAIGNYFRFLAEDGETLISVARKLPGEIPGSVAVPDGAYFFQISPRQRNTATPNYSAAQVEFGALVTPYEPFEQLEVMYLGKKRIRRTPLEFSLRPLKNLFDPAACTFGQEVYFDGLLRPQADSVTSDFIDVSAAESLSISGLQDNAGFAWRYFVFLGSDKSSVVATGRFDGVAATIAVPAGAHWFRFSPKQRSSTPFNPATAQVERGSVATPYEPFTQAISAINERPLALPQTVLPSWAKKRLLAFGDSITETATVLDDGTYTEGVRSNWPTHIGPMIEAASVRSYAKSGASFREYSGQQEWQKLSHQIERASAHNLPADVIVVAAGTNDGLVNLGDYAAAMAKTTLSALDRSNTIEAMRWAFWSIRTAYPLANCFAVLPIQRADVESSVRQPLLDAIAQMARRYNFVVIDAHNESGIVKDFEVPGAQGRDLYDGLHPGVTGQEKMARLIAAKIKAALT